MSIACRRPRVHIRLPSDSRRTSPHPSRCYNGAEVRRRLPRGAGRVLSVEGSALGRARGDQSTRVRRCRVIAKNDGGHAHQRAPDVRPAFLLSQRFPTLRRVASPLSQRERSRQSSAWLIFVRPQAVLGADGRTCSSVRRSRGTVGRACGSSCWAAVKRAGFLQASNPLVALELL